MFCFRPESFCFYNFLRLILQLHYIMQYLIVAVVTKKRKRYSPHAKLDRFRLRMQVALANIEQSIFEKNGPTAVVLTRHLQKKVAYSLSLLNFLIIYVSQLL